MILWKIKHIFFVENNGRLIATQSKDKFMGYSYLSSQDCKLT